MEDNLFEETGLDKSLPYISVFMEKTDTAQYPKYMLPDGYRFKNYEPGMEEAFAKLQFSVGGTENAGIAREVFMREFSGDLDALKERMIYVVAENGECVGTACLWWGSHLGENRPRVHWVTVHPAHQNKGISKAILTRLFDIHNALQLEPYIYLVSQTWSYKAINIYIEFGFSPFLGEKPAHFQANDFVNENALAWNLIYDMLEQYRTEKERGKTMSNVGAQVVYLFNSGFAVKKGERLFIFDYYNFMPFRKQKGLEGGVINPEEIKDLDVTVFASHAHMDHFVPSILKWGKEIKNLRYVLSYDIDAGKTENVTKVYPNAIYELDGLKVRTLKSTDEGVAFIVETEGLKIYHAGDLNWWYWEGEPDEDNKAMGDTYKKEIDMLKGETFDIAFVPVDPRLGKEYLWGLDYFMKTAEAKVIFPMHFRNSYSIFDRVDKDPSSASYRNRVVKITRRGEKFEI